MVIVGIHVQKENKDKWYYKFCNVQVSGQEKVQELCFCLLLLLNLFDTKILSIDSVSYLENGSKTFFFISFHWLGGLSWRAPWVFPRWTCRWCPLRVAFAASCANCFLEKARLWKLPNEKKQKHNCCDFFPLTVLSHSGAELFVLLHQLVGGSGTFLDLFLILD